MAGKKISGHESAGPDHYALMARRLSSLLREQIDALDSGKPPDFSEDTVKTLLLLAKTLQSMQEATRRADQTERGERDSTGEPGTIDILAFRSELERRIRALDTQGEDPGVSGTPLAGGNLQAG